MPRRPTASSPRSEQPNEHPGLAAAPRSGIRSRGRSRRAGRGAADHRHRAVPDVSRLRRRLRGGARLRRHQPGVRRLRPHHRPAVCHDGDPAAVRAVLGRAAAGQGVRGRHPRPGLDPGCHPPPLAEPHRRVGAAGRARVGRGPGSPRHVVAGARERPGLPQRPARPRHLRHPGDRAGGLLGFRGGPGNRRGRGVPAGAAGHGHHVRRLHRPALRHRRIRPGRTT